MLFIGWWAYSANSTPYHVPYGDRVGPDGIADERAFYARLAQGQNPLLLEDYEITAFYRVSVVANRLVADGDHVVCTHVTTACHQPALPLNDRWRDDAHAVVSTGNVGIASAGAPLRAHIADHAGLGDPLAARMKLLARGRPGHEKLLPVEWTLARFADPAAPVGPGYDPAVVEQARLVIACPQWQSIEEAVSDKLTVGRFFRNLFGAFGRDDLRIDVTRPPTDCRFQHG